MLSSGEMCKKGNVKMSKDDKECKGCFTYKYCRIPIVYKGIKCPCTTCLVKPICMTIECEAHIRFLDSIDKELFKQLAKND
jgi:hypothetical protein